MTCLPEGILKTIPKKASDWTWKKLMAIGVQYEDTSVDLDYFSNNITERLDNTTGVFKELRTRRKEIIVSNNEIYWNFTINISDKEASLKTIKDLLEKLNNAAEQDSEESIRYLKLRHVT